MSFYSFSTNTDIIYFHLPQSHSMTKDSASLSQAPFELKELNHLLSHRLCKVLPHIIRLRQCQMNWIIIYNTEFVEGPQLELEFNGRSPPHPPHYCGGADDQPYILHSFHVSSLSLAQVHYPKSIVSPSMATAMRGIRIVIENKKFSGV